MLVLVILAYKTFLQKEKSRKHYATFKLIKQTNFYPRKRILPNLATNFSFTFSSSLHSILFLRLSKEVNKSGHTFSATNSQGRLDIFRPTSSSPRNKRENDQYYSLNTITNFNIVR